VLKRGVQMGFVTPIVHALTDEDWFLMDISMIVLQEQELNNQIILVDTDHQLQIANHHQTPEHLLKE